MSTESRRPTRVTRVLCAADPRGSTEAVEALLRAAAGLDVQALALVGDLRGREEGGAGYATLFRALGAAGLDTFWVPGPSDAPIEEYLREAHNIEIVHPFLHGVHGTAAFAPGPVLVAGFGGAVDDDPGGPREERERLRYPRWEPEYRLKLIGRELAQHEQPILLFSTPPAHKGRGTGGSEALAELAVTHRARLVVCGGEPRSMLLGRTLVVAPGPLAAEGVYAVADLHARSSEHAQLSVGAR